MKDAEKCPYCDKGTHGLDGEPKWCCYCGSKLDGTPISPCKHQYAVFPRSEQDHTGIMLCINCQKPKFL